MKCALVTGGSRGIGRAICQELAAAGYYVLINYRSRQEDADRTLALIREQGGDGELLPFDVGDREQVRQRLAAWIDDHSGHAIEVLVNNAGIRADALMLWMEAEQWSDVMRTNLDGFYFVTRTVLHGMLQRKYGRIINIVSLAGLKGGAGQTNYSAAKAGVIGATKALAAEMGRYGITVNAIAPGYIHTEMTKGLDEGALKMQVPVRRFGDPAEVAFAVGFLASPRAGYITAEVLNINGGLYS
ncbi:MAG TPA: 3-oxoacyl-ACP reductase FabG [Puia sp.]|nr:3-oxoacyl-ACP reductase FabG [Puia sp.]